MQLCRRPAPGDVGNLLSAAHVLQEQKLPALADRLLIGHGTTSLEVRKKLLENYRERVEKAWPKRGSGLSIDSTGLFYLKLTNCTEVERLDPLEGMPLSGLDINGCNRVRDLKPLRGMPLKRLNVGQTQVTDLSDLHGMSLTVLDVGRLYSLQDQDLTPLKRNAAGIAGSSPL